MHEIADQNIGKIYNSIFLGGYRVLAGDQPALKHMLAHLPKVDIYPFKLMGHGAFHTPMLSSNATRGMQAIEESLFSMPKTSLIDGRGKIWRPMSTDLNQLYHYTLDHQVVEPYDFSKAIEVALKEFAPDNLILLGPGSTLGGSLGQVLIDQEWNEIRNKVDFINQQKADPFLLAMGLKDQRKLVLNS